MNAFRMVVKFVIRLLFMAVGQLPVTNLAMSLE